MCRAGTTHWFYTHTHWGYESGRVMVGLDKDKTLSYCNTIEAERNTVWQALETVLHQVGAASKEDDHRWLEQGVGACPV